MLDRRPHELGSLRLIDDASITAPAVSVEPTVPGHIAAIEAWRERSAGQRLDGASLADMQRAARRDLGLPVDQPLVLVGHQAGIWHAGIVAKWFVADAVAARANGAAIQLVVDEDVNDAALVQYPGVRQGRLVVAQLPVAPARRSGPTALQPAVELGPPEVEPVPEARDGLDRIRSAMNAARSARSVADQAREATDALLGDYVRPMATVLATGLLTTTVGAALIRLLRRDPDRCAAAYNRALALDPRLARPLGPGELPLWRLAPGRRDRVHVSDVDRSDDGSLAPRAFLMTAIARLGLCDLFVHGTGGGRYERVTEAWMREWLGLELAPMSVATATLRLPLMRYVPLGDVLSVTDVRRMRWDPDGEGHGPSDGKRAWLERIASTPRGSRERADAYRGMTAFVRDRRAARASDLARADALAAGGRDAAVAREIARSRTWPWPLHSPATLAALRASAEAFGGDASR